jgi:hypothetical protein
MKIPQKIIFHRPAFIKNSNNPLINHVFRKERDNANVANNGNMELVQHGKSNRHRLFEKIIGRTKAGYSNNVVKKNGAIFIQLPTVQTQFGHTCKPTALANLDNYYAAQYKIPNIPMRKTRIIYIQFNLMSMRRERLFLVFANWPSNTTPPRVRFCRPAI